MRRSNAWPMPRCTNWARIPWAKIRSVMVDHAGPHEFAGGYPWSGGIVQPHPNDGVILASQRDEATESDAKN